MFRSAPGSKSTYFRARRPYFAPSYAAEAPCLLWRLALWDVLCLIGRESWPRRQGITTSRATRSMIARAGRQRKRPLGLRASHRPGRR